MKNQTPTYGNNVGPQGPQPQGPTALPTDLQAVWAQRMRKKAALKATYADRTLPNWLVGKSVAFFFIAMIVCWVVFGFVPEIDLVVASVISVVLFFYAGSAMSKGWSKVTERRFLQNVFVTGVMIRVMWVLYMFYIFNPNHYGTTFGSTEDVEWYIAFGQDLSQWCWGKTTTSLSDIITNNMASIDDVGYPMWLGIIYTLTNNSSDVLFPLLIKTVLSSYCAVCIYRIAKLHFGEGTARLAALFICLNPNMIYWCGTMMKESEMVFLCCLALNNIDQVLSSGEKISFKNLWPGLLATLCVMFFRTVLAIIIFMAIFAHIVLVSSRVMSYGKKIITGVLVALTIALAMGERFKEKSQNMITVVQSSAQQENMEWRARRENGNAFAKYASAAVFAPLIFTIPFPAMNQILESQTAQHLLSGGNYIKNVFSFFVIIVMFIFLLRGEWRKHVFIIAYTVGYLMVLVLSSFAHSGRFHMPIWPMLMLFAAYGIQLAKQNKKMQKWYWAVLVVEVLVCLGWNWFKIAGRGML